jgi:glycerol transport system ATP-binding protein
MNIIAAEVSGREARIDGRTIALTRGYQALPSNATIEIGVRPEFVDITEPAPDLLSANIERIDDLGRVRFARVKVGDVKFAARVPAGFAPSGTQVGLKFQPSHVHVYADSRLVEGA